MSPGQYDRHNSGGGGDATRPLRYAMPAAAGSVWLGLGWVSIAGLAATVAAVVLLLVAGLPLWAVTPLAAGGSAVSALPVAGRPLLAWLPTFLSHQAARVLGASSWARPLADASQEVSESVTKGTRTVKLRIGVGPRQLWLLCPDEDRDPHPATLAAIAHGPGRDRRRTIVFEVVALGRFGVLDACEQDTELARWGSSLAVLYADPRVRSVQWLTQARPDTHPATGTGLVHPGAHGDRDAGGPGGLGELQEDYRHLTAAITRQATRHRHLLALTLNPTGRTATAGPSATGHDRPEQTGTTAGWVENSITRAARDTATALLAAELLARPLSATELGSEVRLLLDPAAVDDGPVTDPEQWEPVSTRACWEFCQTDDTVHRCFTITGWPRLALSADWLAPLLHDTPAAGTCRTLSVHTRPVAPEHAARRARAASAKARLDASDRSRLGFTPHAGGSVSDTLAEIDAAATETELVAGYRMTDLSALLSVSAVDAHHLDAACRQVRALAAAHRLELRPLHGQHLSALATTLPLGLNPGTSS